MAQPLQLFYDGYDPAWVLGRDKGPPVETKPKPAAPKEEKKPPAPIELKVPFCCERCEEKIQAHLIEMEGVESVRLDSDAEKVTITGKVKPDDALKEAKRVVKRSEFWPKKKEEGKKDDGKKDDKKKDGGGGGGKKEGGGGGGGGGAGGGKKEGGGGGGVGGKKEEKKEDGGGGGGGGGKKEDKKDDKKEGPPPPIELKVTICCEGCAARLYDALKSVDDVTQVNVNSSTGKITVTGKAKAEKVLKAVKKVKPGAELIAAKKK